MINYENPTDSHHQVREILYVWTPEKFAVITLKFEQAGFTVE